MTQPPHALSEDELELIARIEDMTSRAWPPAELDRLAGWELRATGGFSRRANSANPYPPHPAELVSAVDTVEDWYVSRGRRPIFRITPVSEPAALVELLESKGYGPDRGTVVMTGAAADGPAIDITPSPSPAWIAAKDAMSPLPPEQRTAWLGLLSRTRGPAGYGLIHRDGRPAAAGHAVVEGSMAALFGLVVDPRLRRRGLGEKLSRGLIGWAASRGATMVWLQVYAVANQPAVALYTKLGLRPLYEYWYLEAPVAVPEAADEAAPPPATG